MNYIGQVYGFQVFEDENVLKLKYPTGKKDGNKLGKRKRNILAPDVKFSKSKKNSCSSLFKREFY